MRRPGAFKRARSARSTKCSVGSMSRKNEIGSQSQHYNDIRAGI